LTYPSWVTLDAGKRGLSGLGPKVLMACSRRRNAMPEPLAIEELDAQVVAELPDREMLTLVVIRNLSILSNNRLNVTVRNNEVAVQVCALVNAIDALTVNNLVCRIRQ
jgi:hypothetical protein